MKQVWHDLLFMHWPMSAEQLRPLIPAELEIESCEGSAWVGVVPFHMSGIRAHWMPPIPGSSAFPELNVRTYVRVGGRPGVWFFSLDAANSLGVAAARHFFHLPYFRARMHAKSGPHGEIQYDSHRTHSGAPSADFRGSYRASNDNVFQAYGKVDTYNSTNLGACQDRENYCQRVDFQPVSKRPRHVEIVLGNSPQQQQHSHP